MLSKMKWMVALVAALLVSLPAVASGPPAMSPVTFPVSTTSIVSEVSEAGGTILLAVFGVSIGFYLIWKLYMRIRAAV